MFLSAIFILSSIQYFIDFSEREQRFFSILSLWSQSEAIPSWSRELFLHMLSWSTVLFTIGIILVLLAGLFVFLGVQARLVAFLLILFMLVKVLLLCPLWMHTHSTQWVLPFLHNLSVMGGLCILFSVGKHRPA